MSNVAKQVKVVDRTPVDPTNGVKNPRPSRKPPKANFKRDFSYKPFESALRHLVIKE